MTKKRIKAIQKKSASKEAIIKNLSKILSLNNFKLRREQLKQGSGWRAISGQCRVDQEQFIFLDSRLPQDDQISFLVGKILELEMQVDQETLSDVPERIVAQLQKVELQNVDSQAVAS